MPPLLHVTACDDGAARCIIDEVVDGWADGWKEGRVVWDGFFDR
jgi:hypothetical protein